MPTKGTEEEAIQEYNVTGSRTESASGDHNGGCKGQKRGGSGIINQWI